MGVGEAKGVQWFRKTNASDDYWRWTPPDQYFKLQRINAIHDSLD